MKQFITKVMPIVLAVMLVFSAMPIALVSAEEADGQETQTASIQKLIDEAEEGATVEVPAGIYDETLIIKKSITLQGPAEGEAVIRPKAYSSTGMQAIVQVTTDLDRSGNRPKITVNIKNITVDGSEVASANNSRAASGIAIEYDNELNVEDCTVENVKTGGWNACYGFSTWDSSVLNVKGSVIKENGRIGILTKNTSVLNVEGCEISGVTYGEGETKGLQNGIQLESTGKAVIKTTEFKNFTYYQQEAATGILCCGDSTNTVEVIGCTFESVPVAINARGTLTSPYNPSAVEITDCTVKNSVDFGEGHNPYIFATRNKSSVTVNSGYYEGSTFWESDADTHVFKGGTYTMNPAYGVIEGKFTKVLEDEEKFQITDEADLDEGLYVTDPSEKLGDNKCLISQEEQVGDTTFYRVTANHTLTKTDEVPATCTEDGTKAYWTCSVCEKMFSDEAATTEIEEPEKLEKTGHTLKHTAQVDPTCNKVGKKEYWQCEVCRKVFADEACTKEYTSPEELLISTLAPHTAVKTDEVPATCTADGTQAYWTCSVCEKLFSDEACTNEITAPAVITKTGHNASAEWSKDETNHWHACANNADEKLDSAAHTFAWVIDAQATTEAAGSMHEECTVCGQKRSENTEIPKLEENKVESPAQTQTSVELTWEAPEVTGTVTKYQIYDGDKLVKEVEATENKVTIDGLTAETKYNFTVVAVVDSKPQTVGGLEVSTKSNWKLGDVNHDNAIDSTDATLVLQRYAEIIDDNYDGYYKEQADVDGVNGVDSTDATLILQYFAEIIKIFPAEEAKA